MPESVENTTPITDPLASSENPSTEGLRFSTQAKGEPFEVAVLALQNLTIFPETVVPLGIGRPRSLAAVEAALATEEKLLGCITVRPDRSGCSTTGRSSFASLQLASLQPRGGPCLARYPPADLIRSVPH